MKAVRFEIEPGVFRLGCAVEHRLRDLFRREDELLAELADIRDEQRHARNEYAKGHGLLIRPSVEALRKVLRNG